MIWYIIIDLKNFLKQTRIMSFEKFKEANDLTKDAFSKLLATENDNLHDILSEKEAEMIIMPFLKNDEPEEYKISEDTFIRILESLNSRIVSNILVKLASKNVIEMAFDNEVNDFIFWIKKKNKEKRGGDKTK